MEAFYPAGYTDISVKGGGLILFKQTDGSDTGLHTDIEDREKERDERRFFLCKICKHSITPYETKINIGGHHRHTFINPSGIEYSIGCFSSAEGCFVTGVPTIEYTWFPGYRWNYALCAKCRSHLGWSYRSASGSFYGLILDHLIVS